MDWLTDLFNQASQKWDAFTADRRLSQFEGYEQLRTRLQQDNPLGAALGENVDQNQILQRLETLAAQDPQVFQKFNAILDAPGFQDFAARAAENPALRTAFQDMLTNPSGDPARSMEVINLLHDRVTGENGARFFETVNAFMARNPERVNDFATKLVNDPASVTAELNAFAADQRLSQFAGYETFRDRLTQEGPLRTAMSGLMGANADPAQLVQRLEAMAAQDPQVFQKFNAIMEAPGFEAFAQRVSANPALSAAFQDMLTNPSSEPGRSMEIINGLHRQVTGPDGAQFFGTVTGFMDQYPDQVTGFANRLTSNPGGAIAELDGMMQNREFMNMFSGLKNMLSNLDLGSGLEGLAQILLAVINCINGIGNFVANGIGNFMQSGNVVVQGNGGPTPERPVERVGAQPAADSEQATDVALNTRATNFTPVV